jgi:hypothetical protein
LFSDVTGGEWYAGAVAWAAASGVANGVGGGRFDPGAPIARQDLAAMLARYADSTGLELLAASREYAGFADAADIAGYAAPAVEALCRAGVISGRPGNIFDPKGEATRAEVAAMLHRLLGGAAQ